MHKVEDVKEKLKSAAEDLREMAAAGHPHPGHLQEQAIVIEKTAESCETILEHSAPVGKSGQGVNQPAQDLQRQSADVQEK